MSNVSLRPLRRVVITGLGIIAPNGAGKEAFWQACLNGQSGIRTITRFDASMLPSRIAGEVHSFHPQHYNLSSEEEKTCSRSTQFALAAAHLALQDAGIATSDLPLSEREQIGVCMGSAMSYVEEGERLWTQLTGYGQHALLSGAEEITGSLLISNAAATTIALHHHLHGPCMVISTGCSAGADAIGEAFWMIQDGHVDTMLAGGSDSAICPIGLDVFCVMGALSTAYNDTPEKASRPYDQKRDGFVIAEGAAVLILEERTKALARGAHIYAELLNFTSNSNAYHMTALPENGLPLQQLIRTSLDNAGIAQDEIGYINSHGSSTPPNDLAETAAYKALFGDYAYRIPISATKSLIGHSQGAASAIEALVTTLVLDQQIIPPTINLEQPDAFCDLDYVPHVARQARVNVALTHSSGFGGVNSVLILAHPEWIEPHANNI